MELKIKNWSDVTIKKYYELLDVEQDNYSLLAALCECTPEEIAGMPAVEYQVLLNQAKFLNDFTFDTEHDLKKIQIGNRKYKVCQDWGRFTAGQYIDFQSFYTKNDLKTYYGNILATFVVPEGKKYGEGYDVVEEAKYIYDNLDIQRANQLMFFFRKRWHNSTIVTLNYLSYQAQRMLKKKRLTEEERKMWTEIAEVTKDTPGWRSLI